jgi:hypothetical protein
MLKTAAGYRHEKIADALGIDPKTLRRHFRVELDNGKADADAMVVERLYREAITGANPVPRYYIVNRNDRLGLDVSLIEPPKLGISFRDGGPGRVRRVPFELPSDVDTDGILERPDNADRLDAASQSFLPPSSAPPSSGPTASPSPPVQEPQRMVTVESVRQMSPAELMAHNADPTVVAVIEPDRDIHVHTPKVDSPCSRCRQLWVQQP